MRPTTVVLASQPHRVGRPRVRSRPAAEPLVVETDPLADALEAFIRAHDVEHPRFRVAMYRSRREIYHVSGIVFVSQESGLSGARLDGIRRRRFEFTSMSVADLVLTAIGRTEMLFNEIVVYGNPNWSRRRVLLEMRRRGWVPDEGEFWEWID